MQLIAIIIVVGILFLLLKGKKGTSEGSPIDRLTSPELEDMRNCPDCPQELIEEEIIRLRMVASKE
jgi:hypothetical protein